MSDERDLHTALDEYDQGDAAKAEPLLRRLAARYPTSFEANEALGSLYAEAGDFRRALPFLERARDLQPGQAIGHSNLGAAYLKVKRVHDAVHELEAAAKLDPSNGITQSTLGEALMLGQQASEAAKAFEKASSARPDDAGLRYNWALALFDSGAFLQAENALKPVPAGVDSDQLESLRGDIEEKLGHYKEAVQHYQSAAQMNPTDGNIYALTAEFLRHWTWDEAIQIARFGAQKYPSSTHFRVAEGVALYGSAHYPAAASVFAKLLADDPENAMYADVLGRSCSLVPDGVNDDCNRLEEFAREHPENAEASTYAAIALLHRPEAQQDTTKVQHLLEQALAADPKFAEAYLQMGVLEQMRLDWSGSVAVLEKAVALRPADPEAHYRLSRAYSHLGRREDAKHEIALQQQYSQQEKDRLNGRMQEVVTFLLNSN